MKRCSACEMESINHPLCGNMPHTCRRTVVATLTAEDLARAYAAERATKPRLKRDRGKWCCSTVGTPLFSAETPAEAYIRWARAMWGFDL